MTLSANILKGLCPMHVVLDPVGRIIGYGSTIDKLEMQPIMGTHFLDAFELYRPRSVRTMPDLLATAGRKLFIRLRNRKRTAVKGLLVPDGKGGAVINLSFGISIVDAVRDYALTGTDFAATDLAVEMLYLVEAKSAAMTSSIHLNTKLHGAKTEAERRAATDGLTGLVNRAALDEILEKLCVSGERFALMQLDLDFFKQVNDTYGHAAGDVVLRHVAQILLEVTRKYDTAARVGGDEFVLIFGGDVTRERLAGIARRLIDRIELPVAYGERYCTVSASIGICLHEGGKVDPDSVMSRADEALYVSKRSGRAQYSFYQVIAESDQTGGNSALAGE